MWQKRSSQFRYPPTPGAGNWPAARICQAGIIHVSHTAANMAGQHKDAPACPVKCHKFKEYGCELEASPVVIRPMRENMEEPKNIRFRAWDLFYLILESLEFIKGPKGTAP
ncbi:hypothetical protein EVAR_48373_1 [Eumeta japonica]|uniref:Uncharacterized protein n=1 Tax=Eumeta variegata TaxID=151549 RepID=A0A4C1WKA3_EUMVA|nr:hypothetical protein EVAR_48373_1 [Eumeta japonica]